MVRYVILRRFLQEIPPLIYFRDLRVSAWTTPRRGNLRGVTTPDPATWVFDLPTEYSTDDVPAATELTDEYYGGSSDEEMKDWPDANGNSGDDSTEDPPNNQPCTLAINTRHDVGHIKLDKRPSDTCLHTCTVFNQNVNGLGGKQDDKLKKVIYSIRERKIHAYCIQETWQLHNYMLTIRGYTVFHHGLSEKPNAKDARARGR